MNEAETRAERIDPKLRACGWGVVEGSKVPENALHKSLMKSKLVEVVQPLIADYILV
jgi:type I restriction enzyme R subunit